MKSQSGKIYTKMGDDGKTSLFSGKRVFKNHLRIKAYGTVDELNSLLSVVLAGLEDIKIKVFLSNIQRDLFTVGSYLTGAEKILHILSIRTDEMESLVDDLTRKLPPLSNFILPKGTKESSLLFFARAVVRRVERKLVALARKEKVDSRVLVYFNRLSDLLFVLARYLNFKANFKEVIWKKDKQST